MEQGARDKKECKIKCFFGKLIEKVNKKLQGKAKSSKCCSSADSSEGETCCK